MYAQEESDLDEDVVEEHEEVQGARGRALREEVCQKGREVRRVGAGPAVQGESLLLSRLVK
jgi:hypothetical protein